MTTADFPDVLPDSAYAGWAAPGIGTWGLDASHCPRPVARYIWPLFTHGFCEGFGSTFARYGMLLEVVEARPVGGFIYNQVRALGAPPEAVDHPPKEVFDEILANNPAFQERMRAAENVWAEQLWRRDLLHWDTTHKPEQIAKRDTLDAVDLGGLSDDGLLAHLQACTEAYKNGWVVHHTYNGAAILPVGDYLLSVMGWTGLPPHVAIAALSGASPVSTGGGVALEAAARAIAADPGAREKLAADQPASTTVKELSRRQGPVGEALSAYLAEARFLPVDGEDAVGVPTTIECPELIVGRLRAALDTPEPDAHIGAGAAADQLRAAVPEEHRAIFDSALAEARLVYRLRDERAVYGDRQLGTVLRRALLEIGERLTARGRLEQADHAVDLDAPEVDDLLRKGTGPSAADVAERVQWRLNADYRRMPPLFGQPPGPPLPAEWLPPTAARVHAGLGFALHGILGDIGPEATTAGAVVAGLPGASGVAEGRARLIRQIDELELIEEGDILVTIQTGPAFNLVLPLLAGLVTDRGGMLSHAAIVAREFGVPAVVGCVNATSLIPDGARVRIEGDTGTVTVLDGG